MEMTLTNFMCGKDKPTNDGLFWLVLALFSALLCVFFANTLFRGAVF